MMPRNGVGKNRPYIRSMSLKELGTSRRMIRPALLEISSSGIIVFVTISGGRPKIFLDIRCRFPKIMSPCGKTRQCRTAESSSKPFGHVANVFNMIHQKFSPPRIVRIDMRN